MVTIGAMLWVTLLVQPVASQTSDVAEQLLSSIADPYVTTFTIPAGVCATSGCAHPNPPTDQRYVSFADINATNAVPLVNKSFTILAPPNSSAVLDFANQANLIRITNSALAFGPGLTIRGVPSRLTPLSPEVVPYDPTGLLIFPAVTADPGARVCWVAMSTLFCSVLLPMLRHRFPTSHWSFPLLRAPPISSIGSLRASTARTTPPACKRWVACSSAVCRSSCSWQCWIAAMDKV